MSGEHTQGDNAARNIDLLCDMKLLEATPLKSGCTILRYQPESKR